MVKIMDELDDLRRITPTVKRIEDEIGALNSGNKKITLRQLDKIPHHLGVDSEYIDQRNISIQSTKVEIV